MQAIIRFFEDILGYFVEKFSPLWKAITIGGIALIIFLIWNLQTLLNVVSVILWITAFFMFGKLLFNVIRDRNKEGPSGSNKGPYN